MIAKDKKKREKVQDKEEKKLAKEEKKKLKDEERIERKAKEQADTDWRWHNRGYKREYRAWAIANGVAQGNYQMMVGASFGRRANENRIKFTPI